MEKQQICGHSGVLLVSVLETNDLLFNRLANILWSSPSNLLDQLADASLNEQTNRKDWHVNKGLNNLCQRSCSLFLNTHNVRNGPLVCRGSPLFH